MFVFINEAELRSNKDFNVGLNTRVEASVESKTFVSMGLGLLREEFLVFYFLRQGLSHTIAQAGFNSVVSPHPTRSFSLRGRVSCIPCL